MANWYHSTRWTHRYAGITASVFLLILASTGFLLATKGQFGWIRPPEQDGGSYESLHEIVSIGIVYDTVLALDMKEFQAHEDIDRIDYRPDSNIFKVVSKEGYKEVQVDGTNGEVLSIANRVDQLTEDIHDLSFFAKILHQYALPLVAVFLFFLACSGIYLFLNPVIRRRRFRAKKQHSE